MKTKSVQSILGIAALVWMVLSYSLARGGDDKTFKGEIADTQCALNVHSLSQSHKEMIENEAGSEEQSGMRPVLRERARRKIRFADSGQGLQTGRASSGGALGRIKGKGDWNSGSEDECPHGTQH